MAPSQYQLGSTGTRHLGNIAWSNTAQRLGSVTSARLGNIAASRANTFAQPGQNPVSTNTCANGDSYDAVSGLPKPQANNPNNGTNNTTLVDNGCHNLGYWYAIVAPKLQRLEVYIYNPGNTGALARRYLDNDSCPGLFQPLSVAATDQGTSDSSNYYGLVQPNTFNPSGGKGRLNLGIPRYYTTTDASDPSALGDFARAIRLL